MTSTLLPPTDLIEPKVAPQATQAVDTPPAEAMVETEAPRADYVSIYASSIFAVTMLFMIGVGVPCALFLNDWVGGMGLGAMCAVWGGPSFGVMAGAARVSAWHEANHVDF